MCFAAMSVSFFFFIYSHTKQGDTLVIDGSGWIFQLLEGQRVDHSGDYDALHEATVREVSRLRQASGFGRHGRREEEGFLGDLGGLRLPGTRLNSHAQSNIFF